MSDKLKFGVIGLGVGALHIPGFLSHPDCELAALCDLLPEKLSEFSEKYPGVKTYTKAEDLIDDPEIQVVSIASFDHCHKDHVVQALKRNKHIFVEKPLCTSESELEEILAEYRKRPQLKISSNLIMRKYPRFAQLKKDVSSGKLGKIYHMEGDYNYGRIHKIHAGWRGHDQYSVMLGGGIHIMDLLLWLNQDEVLEVSAYGNRICSENTNFSPNDMVVAAVKFQSGAVGKISSNYGCVYPHFHKISLYGTAATFENEVGGAFFYRSRGENPPQDPMNLPYPGAKKGDLIHEFVESILKDREPDLGAADVFRSLKACLAIDQSAREGRPVKVEKIVL